MYKEPIERMSQLRMRGRLQEGVVEKVEGEGKGKAREHGCAVSI